MAQRLTHPHAGYILGDVVVALGVYQNRVDVGLYLETRLRASAGTLDLSLEQKEYLSDRMHEYGLSTLGYSCYVSRWERYRKATQVDRTAFPEGSTIFGLDVYSGAQGRVNFQRDFPLTMIDIWESKDDSFWFASVLRNALAHGQVNFPGNGVNLYNITNQGHKNFSITMQSAEFSKLIIDSLKSFMGRVGPAGGYAPLSDMLTFYN